jgi:hypothetical protein
MGGWAGSFFAGRPEMPQQPQRYSINQVIEGLLAGHVAGLSDEDQAIAVMRVAGWTPTEIGLHFTRHPRTVYGRLEHTTVMFCAAAGLFYDPNYLFAFGTLHALCSRNCLLKGVAYLDSMDSDGRAHSVADAHELRHKLRHTLPHPRFGR